MNRYELRDRVFKLLFRIEFNSAEDMNEQIDLFCNDEEYGTVEEKDAEYVKVKYNAVIEHLEEIDKLINDNTTGWDTKRMGKVDVTVLRLAIYEMCFDEDIPAGVAINEAVEIAKTYGQSGSGSFVNAILTTVKKAKEIQ